MSNAADEFLFGGGVPSAKFPTIGTIVTGTIVEPAPHVTEQRDLEGEVRLWSNGDPMKMLVVTIATSERDPEIGDDDGTRRLYVKGSKDPASKSLTAALGAAVRNAKANGLEVGGKLTVTYVSDGKQEKKGYNAPKQYEATYEPPSVKASGDFLDAAPAAAPAATGDASNAADMAKQLLQAGLSVDDVAKATSLPAAVVQALANTL